MTKYNLSQEFKVDLTQENHNSHRIKKKQCMKSFKNKI